MSLIPVVLIACIDGCGGCCLKAVACGAIVDVDGDDDDDDNNNDGLLLILLSEAIVAHVI